MFYVEYFVEHDVFHKPFRHFRESRVLLMVMVSWPRRDAQDAARLALRPGQHRLFNLTVKMATVDAGEDAIQIVNLSYGVEMTLRPL
jgi:hypothetical protein